MSGGGGQAPALQPLRLSGGGGRAPALRMRDRERPGRTGRVGRIRADLNLAEREGFEPSNQVTPVTGLANQRLRPLGHLSLKLFFHLAEEEGFEPSEGVNPLRFSRPPPSAARPLLRKHVNPEPSPELRDAGIYGIGGGRSRGNRAGGLVG